MKNLLYLAASTLTAFVHAADTPPIVGLWMMGQSLCDGSESLPVVSTEDSKWGNRMFELGVRTWLAKDNSATQEKRADKWSPISHASADDPPAILITTKEDKPPVKGEPQKDPTHSAVLGLMLQDTLKPLGVECVLRHPFDGKPETAMQEVLLDRLIETSP